MTSKSNPHNEKSTSTFFSFTGNTGKQFFPDEKSNSLGNVQVVISDKKVGVDDNGDGAVDWYRADVRSAGDYFAGGMMMPERNFNANSYRFGYGGHEKVDEVSGCGNTIDMGDRWLDVRTLRTPKPDRKEDKYPAVSPYSYVMNNFINAVDIDGEDVIFLVSKEGAGGHGHMAALIQDKGGNWFYISQGANTNARGVSAIAGMFSGSFKAGMGIYSVGTKDEATALSTVTDLSRVAMDPTDPSTYNPINANAPITSHLKIETSSMMDEKIFKKANKLQKRYDRGLLRYNIITQNCVDCLQQTVKAGTGNVPLDTDPRPNKYFEKLERKADNWQERINKKIERQERRAAKNVGKENTEDDR